MTPISCVEELQELLLSVDRLLPRGGGTKTALSGNLPGFEIADLRPLAGIVEHEPSEFTVTVKAGTPVELLEEILEHENQYLPFDPVLVRQGATIGGTVSSGLSGSGRLRYGGIRDFILAVQMVDGNARVIRGGQRVVKNAAGFDLPKLLVGSLGGLGILTEVTLKVFPLPPASWTLRVPFESLEEAVRAMVELRGGVHEMDALELDSQRVLWMRIRGVEDGLEARADRLRAQLDNCETVAADEAAAWWSQRRKLGEGRGGATLVKVPTTPARIVALDRALEGLGASRHYGAGGQQAWLSLQGDELERLDRRLRGMSLRAVVVLGEPGSPLLGHAGDAEFLRRIGAALDPKARFRPLGPAFEPPSETPSEEVASACSTR